MKTGLIAMQEIRVGLRNRWVLATTLLLAALALSLVLLGSAPTGTVKADPLAVVIVSLSSLTIFLVPLIALLLSFDAIVGEHERGTLMLLLAYPVARWQVVVGKVLGQVVILAIATLIGYGVAAAALWLTSAAALQAWGGFAAMVLTSVMLGAAFVAMGTLASTLVRERATAAGLAVAVWLFFVLLYDTALLGVLVADTGRHLGTQALDVALLLNPADVYRLFNMSASAGAAVYSGMAGPGTATGLPDGALLAALTAWVLAPL
ncbi:MAG: ABC transporter permease, partial [Proteobacteria bacterium]|nr:ABC transporter permease [Pseudomonadota bacterium]